MLAGLKAGANPLRNSRHQSSVAPVTRSGCPLLDIICGDAIIISCVPIHTHERLPEDALL